MCRKGMAERHNTRAVQWETGKVELKSRVRPMSLCVGYAKAVTLSYQ